MGNKPIIGVDVDLTIVDTDLSWIDYIGEQLFPNNPGEAHARVSLWKKQYGSVPYNLSEVFVNELKGRQTDLYEFWRSETLYNLLEPIEGAVEALKALSEEYRIVFCSAHKGWHAKSKYYFLDKWFPFHSGVILTKEKWMCCNGWNVYIDDRVDILNKCKQENENLLAIQYDTHYTQSLEQGSSLDWEIRNYGKDWEVITNMILIEELLR